VRSTGSLTSGLTTGNREGFALLAQACEHADLTPPQAAAAQLAAEGHTYRAIADALSLPYPTARATTRKAAAKLARCHGAARRWQRRWLRDMMDCLRNTAPCHANREPAVYAPIPGGFDRRPVSFRPVPEGERPEDLDTLMHFLRDLPRALIALAEEVAESAVSFCG